ncbi:MAG: GDP-mannose 4,6-dehydratase [Chloroflexi bacterium]|nr:GDP-mannose 4,6-dehydratase [Chloroflexota bacterium]
MSLAESYAGRSVFVTGHTGFKGAWLTEWLGTLGAEVTGYALDPATQPNLFEALDLVSRVRHLVADVRASDRLLAEVQAAQPSVIFHLAAQAIVRRAYAEPRETFETNVMGTVNVLEAARACPSVRAVVIVTSDKCYQNHETDRAFRETDAMGGRDPYSASKGCAELVTAAYRESFFADVGEDVDADGVAAAAGADVDVGADVGAGGAAVASARAGNVIGGGDWAEDRIIPDSARALAAGAPIIVRNPDAIRPWQHVLEPLSGYLQLGALLLRDGRHYQGAWNFGPTNQGGDRSVRWVVEQFLGEWGSGTWSTPSDAARQPHEAHRLSLDSAKAREQLGWAPVWDAQTAVRQTANWYREYYRAPATARELVEDQLRAYQAEARAAGLPWAGAAGVTTT